MQTVPLLFSFLFLHALVLFHSQRSGPILVPYRSACTAIATRFEGIIKPPFVSLLRPFELPMVEHKGRKRVCAFLPSVATFEVSNVSEGDCFAALLKSSCHSALAAAVAGRPPYRFGGAMGSSRPTVFGHAGRVTLPMRRPWRALPAYDRFTVLWLLPFICRFTI